MLTATTGLLGGSTIAAACGIDPYCSPIRLWLDLTQGREREDSEAMRLGRRLEPVIFDELNERGVDCERTPGLTLIDETLPWLVGHPDGLAHEGLTIVEAKATGRATNTPHPWHEAQVQTYMHLADLDVAIIAQLAWPKLTVWRVERHQHLIDTMLGIAERFVGQVVDRVQPAPQGHPDDRNALAELWPSMAAGRKVRETREIADARRELADLLTREKAWKSRVDHLRAVITDHMGDAETLISAHDEPVASWRDVTSRRLDTARLKTEQPDIYQTYSTETTGRRFTLS